MENVNLRLEHPRPDAGRENWLSLNGEWDFKYYKKKSRLPATIDTNKVKFDKINVPCTWQRTGYEEPAYINCPYSFDPRALGLPKGEGVKPPELPEDFVNSFGDFDVYGNENSEIAIVTYGRCFSEACKAQKELHEKGIDSFVVNLNTIKPINDEAVRKVLGCRNVYFFEEGQRFGGIGETYCDKLYKYSYKGKVKITAVNGVFPTQNSVSGLLKAYKLDKDGMVKVICEDKTGE